MADCRLGDGADDEDVETESPLEVLLAKQRKEKREFQGRAVSMKHSVPKGDKKKRREVVAELERVENEMKARHANELDQLKLTLSKQASTASVVEKGESIIGEVRAEKNRSAKALRRKEKKAEEMKRRIAAEQEDAKNAPFSSGKLETEEIAKALSERNFKLHEIAPDGDCLYNAIAHQLSMRSPNGIVTGDDVRRRAADYILVNRDDFLPFLMNEDGDPISPFEFEEYCEKIRRCCKDGGMWGGEPELKAISCALEKRIEVVQPGNRITVFGEEYSETKPLIITYHRFAYNLGEHYNSTSPSTI
ncbi:hypothetical protein AB6A40_002599 [Gnathostoma spinigerum]|uniref:OTU domain-containing protein n=1 Tax=Gnathostoma spinigerum TaxID=75299 RepID=A0ABD6E709_9BILA